MVFMCTFCFSNNDDKKTKINQNKKKQKYERERCYSHTSALNCIASIKCNNRLSYNINVTR